MIAHIPKAWSDVTISQYRQILKLGSKTGNEKTLGVIQALTGYSKKSLLNLSVGEFKEIVSALEFTNTPPSAEIKDRFEIDGIQFALVPDLNGLTVGEIIDLEEWVADWDNSIHKIVGVLYRPIVKEDALSYEIEPYDSHRAQKAAELFDTRISIEIAYAVSLFFSLIGSVSWISTKSSLMHQ